MKTREFVPVMPATARTRYGITESKKAELDMLTNQVIEAQHLVEQQQAAVNALAQKSANFNAFLVTAQNNKAAALANRDLVYQVVEGALALMNASQQAVKATAKSDDKTKELASTMKELVDKLIFSAELVNKLANLVVRKKALNPLISDDLVKMVATAGADANSAVSLTLVALQSTFASQASNLEMEAVSVLEYIEAITLYKTLTGQVERLNGEIIERMKNPPELTGTLEYVKICKHLKGVTLEFVKSDDYERCLLALIEAAYKKASDSYAEALVANDATTLQLSTAQSDLAKAQMLLASLQAGSAAANAAALAS